ncbi:uncharacterized protein BDZ99DRAFT_564906 [Mytilinidion resinicola]|uniref:Uncharacterized protein n=1 Tax=Mytilinidion resinicola TaxID=574789 RepID=A0A6A6ZA74_9PEZI|nr:uncharacterized protein BDZ99DRAFT_564906 [Mytilinidion resinicola]KAF2817107.1 hypothetical protein BDZ99DRAFT_564906 [Mytilinidion resinicola]
MTNWVVPLAPLRSGRFSYGSDGLMSKGRRRVDAPKLRELLFPNEVKIKGGKLAQKYAEQEANEQAKRIVKKKWIIAQLTHYGVASLPRARARSDENKELLCRSVKEGKVMRYRPQHIRDIEAALTLQYEEKNTPHMVLEEQRVSKLIEEQKGLKTEGFEKLSTPGLEAAYVMAMFMRKYFLNDGGTPDQSKAPGPLVLTGFGDRSGMHNRAQQVPGLETYSGGEGNARTIVVGWDRSAVWGAAGNIDSAQRAEHEKEKEFEWAEVMKKHGSFIKSLPKSASRQAFSIEQARGSYAIQCDKITSEWPQGSPLKLRIVLGLQGVVGMFHFGVIEGIMWFEVNEEGLLGMEHDEDESQDEDNFEDEDEDEDEDKLVTNPLPPSNKRKASSTAARPTVKRGKSTSTRQSRRLFLKWRGRETGEGEIQLDHGNSNMAISTSFMLRALGSTDIFLQTS